MTFPKFHFWPEQPPWIIEYNFDSCTEVRRIPGRLKIEYITNVPPNKILKRKRAVSKNPGLIKTKTK